jgi:hypothetical protein
MTDLLDWCDVAAIGAVADIIAADQYATPEDRQAPVRAALQLLEQDARARALARHRAAVLRSPIDILPGMLREDVRYVLDSMEEADLAAAILVFDRTRATVVLATDGIEDLPGFLRMFADASVDVKQEMQRCGEE